ncbi:MAG: hypothetical protein KDH20_17315 [Rhodocyclaceae bacterium]|nr:hypothetical protein [Rhodocyclaceae bacterium]
MPLGNAPTRLQFLLQRAGLSIPGASALSAAAPLEDPADRNILARLVAEPPGATPQHPPSQPPPAPPVPLPSTGSVLMGHAGPVQKARDGAADSIWLDLGYPIGAEARRALVRAGLSRQGLEALAAARPVTDAGDRLRLADWLVGGGAGRRA